MSAETKRVAVLIDFENLSHKLADRVFEEAAKLGDVVLRRGYADFSNQAMKVWEGPVHTHLIAPMHQFAVRKGKNSTDIALAVDAMDLMHTGHDGRIDVFCIVSSDSDFTALAKRIRERGHGVVGMGRTPPAMLVQSCDRFIDVSEPEKAKSPATPVVPVGDLTALISKASEYCEVRDGWVTLTDIAGTLKDHCPEFKPTSFGFKTLAELIRSLPAFQFKRDGLKAYIRVAESKSLDEVAPEEAKASATESNVIMLNVQRDEAVAVAA